MLKVITHFVSKKTDLYGTHLLHTIGKRHDTTCEEV